MGSERPILFSGPMVRAILAGEKTQTRRVVSDPRNLIQKIGCSGDRNDDPGAFGYFAEGDNFSGWMVLERGVDELVGNNQDRYSIPCPYDVERLWVRETWRLDWWDEEADGGVTYAADCATRQVRITVDDYDALCDKEAKRIEQEGATLDEAAGLWTMPEGRVRKWRPSIFMPRWASRLSLRIESIRVERLQSTTDDDIRAEGVSIELAATMAKMDPARIPDLRHAWQFGWDSINGRRPGCSWSADPWCWVLTFSRMP